MLNTQPSPPPLENPSGAHFLDQLHLQSLQSQGTKLTLTKISPCIRIFLLIPHFPTLMSILSLFNLNLYIFGMYDWNL